MSDWETVKEEIVQGERGAYFNVIIERDPDYDFRIQRRKKEKPMPTIEPGMLVAIKGWAKQRFPVAESLSEAIYVWVFHSTDFNRTGYFHSEVMAVWDRDGVEIWRRG
jgi:hypothetical protein